MAFCAQRVHNATDGFDYVVLDASKTDLTTCEMVVYTGSEFSNSLENFHPSDALQVSGAVAMVWAIAWSFRAVRNVLSMKESSNETE